MHEMKRLDRDRFITFHKEALDNPKQKEHAYAKWDQGQTKWSKYDISSMMHYDGMVRITHMAKLEFYL